MNAPIADQRQMLLIIRELETPPDESVLERELVQKALNADIEYPEECVNALITTGHVQRLNAPSGSFIRRT